MMASASSPPGMVSKGGAVAAALDAMVLLLRLPAT
jgi:hypothetical protein